MFPHIHVFIAFFILILMLPSYLVHSEDVLHTKRVRVVITFVVLNRIELPSVGQTVGTPEDNSAVQRGSCEHAV